MLKEKINVLFVCTGNICRSPMAEYLFRGRIGPNLPWTICSAGLAAMDGLAASQTAIEVMNEIGLDLKPHRSRELTPELIDAATIILVMTSDQASEIKKRFPKARDRVYLLGSFRQDSENHAPGFSPKLQPEGRLAAATQPTPRRERYGEAGSAVAEKNISDPVSAGIEVYRRTRNDIAGCLDGLIDYLKTYQEKQPFRA